MTTLDLGSVDVSQSAKRLVPLCLRWVCRQQLPSGELPAYRVQAEVVQCWPMPLYSVLIRDLLACADPQTPRFSRHIYEAIPTSERRQLTSAVVTLRWRLRNYIASQQETDGTWRLHGRGGYSPTDAATSALAAASFFDDRGTPITLTRKLITSLNSLDGTCVLAFGALGYLEAVAGTDPAQYCQRLLGSGVGADARSALACWLALRAYAEVQGTNAAEMQARLLTAVHLSLRQGPSIPSTTLLIELISLLQGGDRSEEMALLLRSLLLSETPPTLWRRECLVGNTHSPALGMALMVHAVAQALDGGIVRC